MKILSFLRKILFVGSMSLAAQSYGVVDHVVLIGIDGLGSENLWPKGIKHPPSTAVPNLQRLILEGATSYHALIDHRNFSGPNWMGILSGLNSDEHGVQSNACERGFEPLTIFKVVKDAFPAQQTAAYYDWSSIGCYPEEGTVDTLEFSRKINDLTDQAVQDMGREMPKFLLFYTTLIDDAGHSQGGASIKYKMAVNTVDTLVGKILTKLTLLGKLDKTLIIVTADHGHQMVLTGGSSHASMFAPVPFIVRGPNVRKGEIQTRVRNSLAAPLAAYSLGIELTPRWKELLGNPNVFFK